MSPADDMDQARAAAEGARDRSWNEHTFLRDLFMGNFRFDLIHPFPDPGTTISQRAREYAHKLQTFMAEKVDSEQIDRVGKIPEEVIQQLREMGAFGLKIPREYGGLGFSQPEYAHIMSIVGSADGNLVALLSAHQSIGVPQPVKMFGTEEQKKRFLPRCAEGAISAFALTEPRVGSDPARLETRAERIEDGDAFLLSGHKLWITNVTVADLMVVMARHTNTDEISAFVVEVDQPGVKVGEKLEFMGLRAMENGEVWLEDVRVPRENLLWEKGKGLQLALITLNTGRLTIPAAVGGMARQALRICRQWGQARVQWGKPVGEHEAVAHMMADVASWGFALDAVSELSSWMSMKNDYDVRLEAAGAKLLNTEMGWDLIDQTLQVRGGRGYETARSLESRGEAGVPVERMLRDFRINRIFEGTSEIMRLFIAREAVDKHLQIAGGLLEADKPLPEKLTELPKIIGFYSWWYPSRWLPTPSLGVYREMGDYKTDLRWIESAAHRLARKLFHQMVRYGPKLQLKQGLLFRAVDVGVELFAQAATISKAHSFAGTEQHESARQLARLFCRESRQRVDRLLEDMDGGGDREKYEVGKAVLEGQHRWRERDIVPAPEISMPETEEA